MGFFSQASIIKQLSSSGSQQHSLYQHSLQQHSFNHSFLFCSLTLTINMRTATLLALLPLAFAAPSKRAEPAPVLRPRGVQLVDGKYIVKMKSGVRATSVSSAVSSIEADADYTYSKSFNGFAATLKEDEIEKLKHDPNVSDTGRS